MTPLRAAALAAATLLAACRGGAAPASPEERALLQLGERKLESFCLSCHVRDGPPSHNPLAPRVRGWTREQAYVNVGRLDRLSPAMILAFQGTEEERRGLALALERLGSGR